MEAERGKARRLSVDEPTSGRALSQLLLNTRRVTRVFLPSSPVQSTSITSFNHRVTENEHRNRVSPVQSESSNAIDTDTRTLLSLSNMAGELSSTCGSRRAVCTCHRERGFVAGATNANLVLHMLHSR